MRDATLILIIKDGKILLGMKKRGFGKDKYNGFGGKPQEGDISLEHTAIRELEEESKLKSQSENLTKLAEIEFYFPESKAKDWNQKVHVYSISEYEGNPEETDEMTVQWFDLKSLPYSQMWETDFHWLPIVLSGKKIKAKIYFEEDCNTTRSFEYIEVDNL
jgi:8-oxo-dGTP diphosphatase